MTSQNLRRKQMPAWSQRTQTISKDPCYCLAVARTFFSFCSKIPWQPFYSREPRRGKSVLATLPPGEGGKCGLTHTNRALPLTPHSQTSSTSLAFCLAIQHHLWNTGSTPKGSFQSCCVGTWLLHLLSTFLQWIGRFSQIHFWKECSPRWLYWNPTKGV